MYSLRKIPQENYDSWKRSQDGTLIIVGTYPDIELAKKEISNDKNKSGDTYKYFIYIDTGTGPIDIVYEE